MLFLRLLGEVALLSQRDVVRQGLPGRAPALLALIARSGAAGLARDPACSQLWQDAPEARAHQRLRQLLSDLRYLVAAAARRRRRACRPASGCAAAAPPARRRPGGDPSRRGLPGARRRCRSGAPRRRERSRKARMRWARRAASKWISATVFGAVFNRTVTAWNPNRIRCSCADGSGAPAAPIGEAAAPNRASLPQAGAQTRSSEPGSRHARKRSHSISAPMISGWCSM